MRGTEIEASGGSDGDSRIRHTHRFKTAGTPLNRESIYVITTKDPFERLGSTTGSCGFSLLRPGLLWTVWVLRQFCCDYALSRCPHIPICSIHNFLGLG